MRAKVEEQKKARELRSQGKSVKELARELGAAQSSVSLWVRDIELPPEVQRRLAGRGGRARAARLR